MGTCLEITMEASRLLRDIRCSIFQVPPAMSASATCPWERRILKGAKDMHAFLIGLGVVYHAAVGFDPGMREEGRGPVTNHHPAVQTPGPSSGDGR